MSTDLGKAIFNVQSELTTISHDSNNPHYRSSYASLSKIMEVVRPILQKNNLYLVQQVYSDQDGNPKINTILTLKETDHRLESGPMNLLLDKNNMQGLGSAVTYARRYQLSALLGIVTDEDDDGNEASKPKDNQKILVNTAKAKEVPKEANQSASRNVAKELVELQRVVRSKEIKPEFVSKCIDLVFNKTRSNELNKEELKELIRLLSGDLNDLESYLLEIQNGNTGESTKNDKERDN